MEIVGIIGFILWTIAVFMLGHFVATEQHLKDKIYRKEPYKMPEFTDEDIHTGLFKNDS